MRTVAVVALAGAWWVLAASGAWASGVEIQEQGKGLGNSFAGAQAVGEDPSTVWWNPAGMTRLSRSAVALSGNMILARGDFSDGGSMRAPGVPFLGEEGSTDTPVFVPSGYGVWAVNRCLRLGLGLNAPFGLVTDWGRKWIGRYYGTKSRLETLNVNPSVAWRFNRQWSVGAGVSAMWARAELGNAIDFGAAAQAPQAFDGHVGVEGDSWGFGWNIGVLFEPSPCWRIGAHYRSRVKQTLEGDADFDVPAEAQPIADATGRFVDTDAEAKVTLPDQAALGVAWDVSPRWTLLASVVWTNWETFDELRVKFANPAEPDAVSPLDWNDAWRVAVGAIFRPAPRWALRAGVQWDQSPIPDDTRTPRIPLNDRIWISVGASYQAGRHLTIDLGYAHLFIKDGKIDQSSLTSGFLTGEVEGVVDIVGLQATWTF